MESDYQTRADKFLWSIRIFKTRTQSTEACRKGHVEINDTPIKPSRHIRKGEIMKIRKESVIYTIIVKDFPKNRIPHKLLINFIDDLTPPQELMKLKFHDSFFVKREKGAGRPTKKERRDIDKLAPQ
jgi:ribosome-associated heat shock protein Hsp15